MTVTLEISEQAEAELRAWAERNNRSLHESDLPDALRELVAHALEDDARDWDEAIAGIDRGLQAEREGRFTPLDTWARNFRERHGIAASPPDDADAVVANKMAA